MTSRVLARALFVLLLATLRSAPSAAQDDKMIGARLGLYTKHSQPYFGVEFVLPLGPSIVSLNPNVEYVRLGDTQEFTINADLHCDVPIKGRFYGWAGAGIGLVSTHPDGPAEPDTKDGVGNVFVGIGFEAGAGVPYITAKYMAKRHPEFLLGAGVRF